MCRKIYVLFSYTKGIIYNPNEMSIVRDIRNISLHQSVYYYAYTIKNEFVNSFMCNDFS